MKTRKIIRLQGYDYSREGVYFVTIEPNDHEFSFCKINNGEIQLNEIGKILDDQWKWLFDRYDHIKMDEYIIMPDHFHGIIRILPDSQENGNGENLHDYRLDVRATHESPVGNRAGHDPPVHLLEKSNRRQNLSIIIGAFKMTSSKLIHEAGYKDFKWKRSFHDRILRENELDIKRNYIKNNPKNWKNKT
jgi:REP element-mobilizing transposase RayT